MDQYLNSSKSHLRQTTSKIEPKLETVREIKKTDVWKLENEFYEFALQQFHFVYKSQMQIKMQGNSIEQKYFYEKIRPKHWTEWHSPIVHGCECIWLNEIMIFNCM